MTHKAIAEQVGISRSYLTEIFNGRKPSVAAARKIEKITGIKWHKIMDMTGPAIEAELKAALEPQSSEAA
jgi:transcriptional regulator with XRE-family HTH domain